MVAQLLPLSIQYSYFITPENALRPDSFPSPHTPPSSVFWPFALSDVTQCGLSLGPALLGSGGVFAELLVEQVARGFGLCTGEEPSWEVLSVCRVRHAPPQAFKARLLVSATW